MTGERLLGAALAEQQTRGHGGWAGRGDGGEADGLGRADRFFGAGVAEHLQVPRRNWAQSSPRPPERVVEVPPGKVATALEDSS